MIENRKRIFTFFVIKYYRIRVTTYLWERDLELKKIQHKFYTIKRAFRGGDATEAEAHAAIVKQVCAWGKATTGEDFCSSEFI